MAQTALSGAINLDERNCDGDTALAVAAEFGSIEIGKLLLQNGADANAAGSRDGHTPLHHGYRSLELVELLIDHEADVTKAVEGPINNGWTTLHLAACWGLKI